MTDFFEPVRDELRRLWATVRGRPHFEWATVTSVDPLRVRFAYDDVAVPVAPDSIAGPLMVGDRVRVERQGTSMTVHGRAKGGMRRFALKSQLDAWAAPDGTVAYVSSENRHYVRSGSVWADPSAPEPNNVLWEGAWYMNAGQTVSLSMPVSQQQTGIVLVWSAYTGGSPENSSWNYVFVPKHHVQFHSGTGVLSTIYAWKTLAWKYVYISDHQITGHADNAAAPNNSQVLRYVLGV